MDAGQQNNVLWMTLWMITRQELDPGSMKCLFPVGRLLGT